MKDYVLIDKSAIYKIGLNSTGSLTLMVGGNDVNKLSIPLTKHKCHRFSADIDEKGEIHIAAVIMDTLTYIKYANQKTSTVHLMHLPQNFSITSVIVNAEKQLRLNYCVKSKEGSAIIEYTMQGENWQGKNIYTAHEDMKILYVKKNKNECYAVKKIDNSYMLINAYEPETELFSSNFEIEDVQGVFEGVVFKAGANVYHNQTEFALGQGVYALDGKRVLVKDDQNLREYIIDNGIRFSGNLQMPRASKEYVLCRSNQDKKILLSEPFPYITFEPERTMNGGLQQEVYMQQRTLFQMQAEIKSLKARIKRLEDEQKFLVKNR